VSIFNPYVALVFVISLLASFGSGYYKGGEAQVEKQQAEIAKLNAEARVKEQALVAAVNNQTTQLVKAQNEAKVISQKRNADIESGTLKLRVPVKTTVCPIPATADASTPAGDSVQATAELDRETAKALVAITDKGDDNTRQLNACIDAYNAVYQTLKGKP